MFSDVRWCPIIRLPKRLLSSRVRRSSHRFNFYCCPTAAILTANCAALPAQGFVVQLTGQKKAIVATLTATSATYSWSNAGSKSVGDCRRFRASHEFTYVACFLPHGIGGWQSMSEAVNGERPLEGRVAL